MCVLKQFEKASEVSQIDVGNEGSAFVEVLVGKSSAKDDDYQVGGWISLRRTNKSCYTLYSELFDASKKLLVMCCCFLGGLLHEHQCSVKFLCRFSLFRNFERVCCLSLEKSTSAFCGCIKSHNWRWFVIAVMVMWLNIRILCIVHFVCLEEVDRDWLLLKF